MQLQHNLPDFVKVADLSNVFKRHLKYHLFDVPFNGLLNNRLFEPASLFCSLSSSELLRLKSIKCCFVLYCIVRSQYKLPVDVYLLCTL